MEKEIIIKNNFSVKTYTKAVLSVIFPQWIVWISVLLYIFLLINAIRLITNECTSEHFDISNLMRTEIFALFFPILLYYIFIRSIKTNFDKDSKNKEIVYHILTNDSFEIKGESFSTKHLWTNLLMIKEVKDFFIVYITKNSFLIINKSDLKDNQYQELKNLFTSIDIKKSLTK